MRCAFESFWIIGENMAAFMDDCKQRCNCRLARCKICNPDSDIVFAKIRSLETAIAIYCREELGEIDFKMTKNELIIS